MSGYPSIATVERTLLEVRFVAFFNAGVIENLLKLGIQVILLTQDQRTWKDLGERYLHQNISMFQINLQPPADGSAIANTADDLATQIMRELLYDTVDSPLRIDNFSSKRSIGRQSARTRPVNYRGSS